MKTTTSQVSNPSPTPATPSHHEHPEARHGAHVIDLRFVFRGFRRYWWLALILVSLFGGYGFLKGIRNMHGYVPNHVAWMVITPAESASGPSLSEAGASALLSRIGLAGSGTAGAGSQIDQLLHITKTVTFAEKMQEKYGLMQTVFAESWDPVARAWISPSDDDLSLRQRIDRFLNLRGWSEPGLEDLAQYLGGRLKKKPIEGTPFIELEFQHRDPEKALMYLNLLYNEATTYMQERNNENLLRRKKFLENRLAETNIIELRRALVDLLAGVLQNEMLSFDNPESIAQIIEPARLSKYKTEPDMLRLLFIPTSLGFLLAIGITLIIILVRHE